MRNWKTVNRWRLLLLLVNTMTRQVMGSEFRLLNQAKGWSHVYHSKVKIWNPASSFSSLSEKLEWEKNIQSIWRLLWERPRPKLQNEPPLDSLDPQSPNPFMASLWIGSGEGLAIKGFGDWGSRLSSGGSFWSPAWGRSRSSLGIDWVFFCHFNCPESAVSTPYKRSNIFNANLTEFHD